MEPNHGLETQGGAFDRLLDALFLEHGPATRDAYRRDMAAFALFIGAPSAEVAARALVMAGPLNGNSLVLHFLDAMRAQGKAPATVARRLACLKQLVRKARILSMCTWSIEIKAPKVRSYRDTRGPGMEAVGLLLDAAGREDPMMGARDTAMVRLLFDLGLRRGEVAGLQLSDIEETPAPAAWVLRKGAAEKTRLTIPGPTWKAIDEWLEWRGRTSGPLFVRLDGAEAKASITGRAVHQVIRRLGLAAGVRRCWPHGLRHSAITRVLDMTNDMRLAQQFSGHASLATLQIYDDNRKDEAGHVSEALALDLNRRAR